MGDRVRERKTKEPRRVNDLSITVVLIRVQVGKLSLSFGEDRGLLPVGIISGNPFTYQ
jgi:hypothetical protein